MTLLVRWSIILGGALALLAAASVTIGPLFPSIVVSGLTVLWSICLAGRYGFRMLR
jgi:hypothetical protein